MPAMGGSQLLDQVRQLCVIHDQGCQLLEFNCWIRCASYGFMIRDVSILSSAAGSGTRWLRVHDQGHQLLEQVPAEQLRPPEIR